MLTRQPLQVSNELRTASLRQIALEPLFQARQPQLLQPRDLRLGVDALEMAIAGRRPTAALVHHSDPRLAVRLAALR
jgi:hypothetical protein